MTTATLLIQLLLGVALVMLGVLALTPSRIRTKARAAFPSALAFRAPFAGLCIVGGVALLIGLAAPFVVFFGACLSGLALLGWLATAFRKGGVSTAAPVILLVAALGVAVAQPLGLKVLLLPKADTLPFEPGEARVLKTFAEGESLESVRAGADGNLYLSVNEGLDVSRTDYYRAGQGRIIVRSPQGVERVLFRTPVGSTAGVIAVADDGAIYMSSHGRVAGIWRIESNGTGRMIARLPAGAWPNGLAFGPDGMLYSADSALASVWRIEPATGRFTRVIRSERLAARPFVALAPGANGLQFMGRDMIVTVSDSTEVLKFAMTAPGEFGHSAVVADGVPGDDFAIGADGTLFVTTHPYDTVVSISPDGKRSIVADKRQHVVGATDAAFGRGPNDQNTLYVVTDGGAFTKGETARGQLIAIRALPSQR